MAELSDAELLVVLVPAARADDVVDFLIGEERLSGFTRSQIAGFSRQHSHLSVREAVLGYGEEARFEMLGDDELLDELVRSLADVAGPDQFRYWRLPISASGVIASAGNSPA